MQLSESTHAAGVATTRIVGWVDDHLDREMMRVGRRTIESEELTDQLYQFYLALITTGWDGGKKNSPGTSSIDDIGFAYLHGFYYPCIERVVLTSQIDLDNDGLSEYAGLIDRPVERGKDSLYFYSVRQSPIPRGFACPVRGTSYMNTMFYRDDQRPARMIKALGGDPLSLVSWPANINPINGRVVPALRCGDFPTGNNAIHTSVMTVMPAITLNAWADRLHLWNVETSEAVMGKVIKTPLRLGVSEEHVKSLFYAREAPLTETGRKRPILHWVQSHLRRIKSGIDIDVRQHMRGIIEFEMAGFPFRITNPIKVPLGRRR